MTEPNTYGDIDYDDPSTYTVKYLPSPDAWPSNGPPWLFEDSTPEEIATMQQGAIDAALELEIKAETARGLDRLEPDDSRTPLP